MRAAQAVMRETAAASHSTTRAVVAGGLEGEEFSRGYGQSKEKENFCCGSCTSLKKI